jgi:hypothetical protein
MKKISFSILFALLGLTSCETLSEATKIEMPLPASTVTIPATPIATPAATPLAISVSDIPTNVGTFFSTNGISTDLVQSITLKKMELTITSPTTSDVSFDFIKTIEVSIGATGLNDVKVATITTAPTDGSKTLSLNVESTDLKQYIVNDKISFKFKIATAKPTSVPYTVDIKPTFLVDFKILGL